MVGQHRRIPHRTPAPPHHRPAPIKGPGGRRRQHGQLPGRPLAPPAATINLRQTGAFRLPALHSRWGALCCPLQPALHQRAGPPCALRPRPCPARKNARVRRRRPPEWPLHCTALCTGLGGRRRPPFPHTPGGAPKGGRRGPPARGMLAAVPSPPRRPPGTWPRHRPTDGRRRPPAHGSASVSHTSGPLHATEWGPSFVDAGARPRHRPAPARPGGRQRPPAPRTMSPVPPVPCRPLRARPRHHPAPNKGPGGRRRPPASRRRRLPPFAFLPNPAYFCLPAHQSCPSRPPRTP